MYYILSSRQMRNLCVCVVQLRKWNKIKSNPIESNQMCVYKVCCRWIPWTWKMVWCGFVVGTQQGKCKQQSPHLMVKVHRFWWFVQFMWNLVLLVVWFLFVDFYLYKSTHTSIRIEKQVCARVCVRVYAKKSNKKCDEFERKSWWRQKLLAIVNENEFIFIHVKRRKSNWYCLWWCLFFHTHRQTRKRTDKR